jgi:hypothetical protein
LEPPLISVSFNDGSAQKEKLMDIGSYVVTDGFFGAPYIDRDEQRDAPYPHRHIHGGFSGTDTRITFYFPPQDDWHGRKSRRCESVASARVVVS